MQYEKYELKIQKVEAFFKFIFRHLGKICVACALIAATATGLMVAKGTITPVDGELPTEIYYGDVFRYEAKAFMSEVEYEYTPVGREDWDKVVPLVPGEYQVRAVAKATIGYKYGEPETFTIKKRPLTVNIASSGVHYGSEPSVTTKDLVYSDQIAGASFNYNNDRSYAEVATVLIVDENGTDITSRYEVIPKGSDIYTTRRPVTILFEGATKVYDGKPLKNEEYKMLKGSLADGDRLEVTYENSQTDVGSVPNEVEYKIVNADGKDMTALYLIDEELGDLAVLKREVIIKTGDFLGVYDAQTHKNESYTVQSELNFADGHILKTDAWAEITNADTIDNSFSYSILDANQEDVTKNYDLKCVWGKLTVEKRTVTIKTGTFSKEYDGESLGYTEDADISAPTLIDGILDVHEWQPSGFSDITFVGEIDNEIEISIFSGNDDVTNNYTFAHEWGKLTVTQRNLTVTTTGYTGIYDGKNHFDEIDLSYARLLAGHRLTAEGQVKNVTDDLKENISYTILDSNNKDVTEYYRINTICGDIVIQPLKIKVYSNGTNFIYTGSSWSDTELIFKDELGNPLTSLPEGMSYVLKSWKTFINANISDEDDSGEENVIEFEFVDENGVSGNFEINSVEWGIVKISRRPIKLVTESDEKTYDGTPLVCKNYRDAVEGRYCGIVIGHTLNTDWITGSITNVFDNGTNTYNRDNLKIFYGSEDVTANYDIVIEEGTLTVNPLVITVNPMDYEEYYNGNYHTSTDYELISGIIPDGLSLKVESSLGRQINVCDDQNYLTYTLMKGSVAVDQANYEINGADQYASFIIKKRPIKLKTGSADKIYDGTPLECKEFIDVIVEQYLGIVSGHTLNTNCITGTITNVEIVNDVVVGVKNTYDIANFKIFYGSEDVTANYDIVIEEGTLTVNKRPIKLVTGSAEKIYDSMPLECKTFEDVIVDQYLGILSGHTLNTDWITGSRTNVFDYNKANNTYNLDLLEITYGNEDVTANYDIYVEMGTLTVHKRQVTFQNVVERKKEYDGESLTHIPEQDDVSNILDIHRWRVIDYKSITDVASLVPNEITLYIYDKESLLDVSENYDVPETWGTLTITPRILTVTLGSYNGVYDASDHFNQIAIDCDGLVLGHDFKVLERASIRNVSDSAENKKIINKFSIVDTADNNKDVTKNYEVTFEWGDVDITPYEITLSSNGKSFKYDGTEWSDNTLIIKDKNGNVIENLLGDDRISVTGWKTFVNVRDSGKNEIGYWLSSATGNYAITEEWGTVTIIPRYITIVPNDVQDFEYEGVDRSNLSEIYVGGEGLAYAHWVHISKYTPLLNVKRDAQKNVIEIENVLEFYIIDETGNPVVDGNYEYDYDSIVWDRVKISPRRIELVTGSDKKPYDGKPLVCLDYDFASNTSLLAGHELNTDWITGKQTKVTDYNIYDDEDIGVDNTYDLSRLVITDFSNNNVTGNYDVEVVDKGKLVVYICDVHVRTAGGRWLYDGEAHSNASWWQTDDFDLTDLGHYLTPVEIPTITDFGHIDNDIKFVVKDKDGNIVDGYNIIVEAGELIIPHAIHIYLPARNVIYDGSAYTVNYQGKILKGIDGDILQNQLTFNITGCSLYRTNVYDGPIYAADLSGLQSPIDFTVTRNNTGDDMTRYYYIEVEDYGYSGSDPNADPDYIVLKIVPREIEITTKSAERPYDPDDEEPLSCKEYYISKGADSNGDLPNGQHFNDAAVKQLMTASLNSVGEAVNIIDLLNISNPLQILDAQNNVVYEYDPADPQGENQNYKIKFVFGKLTITE